MAKKNHRPLKKLFDGKMTLGMYLRYIRELANVTQLDFAQRLGISVQHLSNIEMVASTSASTGLQPGRTPWVIR